MALGRPRKTTTVHGDVRWEVDCTPLSGKRHREYFAAKKEADERQREVNQAERAKLNPAFDPNATLRGYSEHWLGQHEKGGKRRTYAVNADTLRVHILPFPIGAGKNLGDVRVRDFTRGHGKAFLLAKRDAEPAYAAGTLRIVYATLRSFLNGAVEDEVIAANPGLKLGKHLKRPTDPDGEGVGDIKAFEADQLALFLATAKTISTLYPLYLSGALGGLRLGELCGWQLDDLHLEQRKADVRRSLGQECSMLSPESGRTKTGRGRTIDLAADLVAVLTEVKAKRPALAMARGWRPVPPWAFVTSNGTPYGQRNVTRDFKRVLAKARLPEHLTPHSLRHSFATLHLLNGEKPQWVQQQLGHASIKLTVDTYGSWIRERNPAAADRLAAVVNRTVNGA